MADPKKPDDQKPEGTKETTTDQNKDFKTFTPPDKNKPADAENAPKPEGSKVIGNWPETLPGHPPKPPTTPGR